MNNTTYILSHVLDYLKLKKYPHKQYFTIISLKCPKCGKTAKSILNKHLINCNNCNTRFTLISIVRKIETDKKDWSKEKILQYLKILLKIEIVTQEEIDTWFDYFEKNKFSMIQIVRGDKKPVAYAKNWQNTEHKDKKEWNQWINDFNANLGLRGGKISGNTIIDIDCLTKKEEQAYIIAIKNKDEKEIKKWEEKINIPIDFEKIMGEPLIQKTFKGFHLIYLYEEDLKFYKYIYKTVSGEVRNDGAYIVIFPSIIERREEFTDGTKKTVLNSRRKFINKPKNLTKIPIEFKNLLQSLKNIKTENLEIEEYIRTESFNYKLIKPGMMGRSNLLIQLGGCYRKKFNKNDTEFLLQFMNKHFFDPPINLDVLRKTVFTSLNKYGSFDEINLSKKIIDYLIVAKTAFKTEIENHLFHGLAKGENKKNIDKTLVNLLDEKKIIKRKKEYEIVETMQWTDDLSNNCTPVTGFKIPYFDDVANFYLGDMIIIGAKNKIGKSTLSLNIIKRIVNQGIKPYYIYTEKQGGRFVKTAFQLGLKDKDFFKIKCKNPYKLILNQNSIAIYDWVRPPDSDFSRIVEIFDYLVEQTENTNSILICFVQLKQDNEGTFFAPNMIGQLPALLCKYVHASKEDRYNTKFEIKEVREAKKKGQYFGIPTFYDFYTKEVKRVDEMGIEEHKKLDVFLGGNDEENKKSA